MFSKRKLKKQRLKYSYFKNYLSFITPISSESLGLSQFGEEKLNFQFQNIDLKKYNHIV